ncbi:alpha/beta hydrolase-fold protein [Acanthopleuribacter pedis]|uniref:Esterase n=1 Tax=Acanthopleuribacter pedis TaxID=442870 RepID=A0A8J7QDJ0_9BACT|nr:alpha/beta hydrolase-fold protein [Acanthopleuribacter pedis]MBO1322557.1 hypothetical protein [Acanthopleuribacter pedis]
MKSSLFFLTVLLLSPLPASEPATEQGEAVTVDLGRKVQIASTVLGETRDILVHLPAGYNQTTDRYPVVYVLDGRDHFHHGTLAAKTLARFGRIPKVIVVAIPNTNRNRDLGRGKDQFKRFINDELVPMIDKTYRTRDRNVLFGHSMAGAFALYMLASEPNSFQGTIAASPSLQMEDRKLLAQFPAFLAQKHAGTQSLYFTRTTAAQEGTDLSEAVDQLAALMKKAPPALAWEYHFIPNETHMTTPNLTLYQGLSVVFRDYQLPSLATFKAFQEYGGMAGIQAFYEKRGETYGIAKDIPMGTYNSIGWMLIEDGHQEAGLLRFKELLKKKPQSPRAHAMLGNALAELNQKEQALATFRAGLELAKSQHSRLAEFLSRRIDQLTKEP